MKSKALLFSLAALCTCSSNIYAQKKVKTAVLRGQNNGHHFLLELSSGPFRRHIHKLEWRTIKVIIYGDHGAERVTQRMAYMDGTPEYNARGDKNWWGTDGGFPRTEIYRFKLRVNGRDWHIPRGLYANCYQPCQQLSNPKARHLWAWIAKDGSRVTVKIWNGDSGSSYGVLWHLRRNGRYSKHIYSRFT